MLRGAACPMREEKFVGKVHLRADRTPDGLRILTVGRRLCGGATRETGEDEILAERRTAPFTEDIGEGAVQFGMSHRRDGAIETRSAGIVSGIETPSITAIRSATS